MTNIKIRREKGVKEDRMEAKKMVRGALFNF